MVVPLGGITVAMAAVVAGAPLLQPASELQLILLMSRSAAAAPGVLRRLCATIGTADADITAIFS